MFNLFGQKKLNFKFKEPETTACFVCEHVFNKIRPILFVQHDADGEWQFLCGEYDHSESDPKIISLKQVTQLDPTVNDLYEMPLKVGAERKSVKDKWISFRLKD